MFEFLACIIPRAKRKSRDELKKERGGGGRHSPILEELIKLV